MLPLSATAQAVMTWLMPDLPPVSIRSDGLPGNGIADRQLAYITSRWPQVKHRYIYANIKRTWAMIDAGEPVCYTYTLINAERRKRAYLVESGVLPPLQLMARADVADQLPLNAQQEVDFPKLLATPTLRGLLSEQRSFGPQLDTALRQRPANASVETTVVGSYGENILTKMMLSRADYTIDYDFILSYYQRRNPRLAELRSFPIAGNTQPITFGYACPRTAWGKASAQKIDHILSNKEGAQVLQHSVEQWLSAETRQRYAEQFSTFYQRREQAMLR